MPLYIVPTVQRCLAVMSTQVCDSILEMIVHRLELFRWIIGYCNLSHSLIELTVNELRDVYVCCEVVILMTCVLIPVTTGLQELIDVFREFLKVVIADLVAVICLQLRLQFALFGVLL